MSRILDNTMAGLDLVSIIPTRGEVTTLAAKLTFAEAQVVKEGVDILKSSQMKELAEAVKKGEFKEVIINGRTIGFEPGFPKGQGYRAMTDAPRNGWTFASDAFQSVEELSKTVFQELHRLNFSDVVKTGKVNQENAASTTKDAFEFAENAWKNIKKNN